MLDLVYVHGTIARTFNYQPDEIGLSKGQSQSLLLGRLAVPQPAFSPRFLRLKEKGLLKADLWDFTNKGEFGTSKLQHQSLRV